MKNVVFIASHLGSGSTNLMLELGKNPRVEVYKTNKLYTHISTLEYLTSLPHKLKNSAAIYADELLFNFSLSCNHFYDVCKFIYLIRKPKDALNIICEMGYKPNFAYDYYRHRLRRLWEMSKNTPKAILLTWDDAISSNGLVKIEKYLNLKQPLEIPEHTPVPEVVDNNWIKKAEITYEKYLFRLKKRLTL